jgi:hypothetical protein
MRMNNLLLALAGLAAAAFGFATPAEAQGLICGISGNSTAASVDYDPFNPTGLGTTSIQLTLKRVNNGGGGFTRLVRFYLKAQNTGADGTTIIPTALTGPANFDGLGLNIFYNFGAGAPSLTGNPTGANRFFLVDFTGNNTQSDTVVVTFSVTLPPNLDLSASPNLSFDVYYACTANPNTADTGIISNAVVFPIRVLSALQASYVGSALDFGEIGDKTTPVVIAAPATYSTAATGNNIRVASSGPYTVAVASQNGYKLKFPASNGTAAQTINYKAGFLGQTLSPATPTFTSTLCQRATLAGQLLPIRATLLEGGDGKMVAPDYKDVITVTITPQVSTVVGVQANCPALVLPTP